MTSPLRRLWLSIAHGKVAMWPAPVLGIVVAAASLIVGEDRGDIRIVVALSGMATFLFGVLLAFTIARTRERLSLVQNLIATGNASVFTVHELMSVFPEEDRRRVRDRIDAYLTAQIDYRLTEYHLAAPEYLAMTKEVVELDPGADNQRSNVHKELVATVIKMGDSRALVEAAVGQAMSVMEWSGMLLLLAILLGVVACLPGGSIVGAVVAGLLASTLVLLVIILRRLDGLRWHERVAIWEPTTRLFRNMGLDPYVPREVVDAGRYRPVGRVRVVDYPDPYPLRRSRVVTVTEFPADSGSHAA